MNNTIEIYYRLRDEVDRKAAALEKEHSKWMACKKGCCGCCMNLTVWPVEFYAILEAMKKAGWGKVKLDPAKECSYLDEDGACRIYPFRPIICRTHGLPLVYWHEDSDPPGYGVIFCEENFDAAHTVHFDSENTLNMDKINEKLARVNLVFLDEQKDPSLESDTRIELRKLVDYL